MSKGDYCISLVSKESCVPVLTKHHYLTEISKGFKSGENYGLFFKGKIVGVCIFTGLPVPELLKGMYGLSREEQDGLYELSRLCIKPKNQRKEHNLASWFVARCIRDLRKNNKVKAILSYADSKYHEGTIYKALGFSYYGLTANKKDFWAYDDSGKLTKQSRGKVNNEDGFWRQRTRKHRFLITYSPNLICKWRQHGYSE